MGLFTTYKTKTDEELMLLVQQGNSRAFDQLYERYNKRVLYFLYKMLGNDMEKAQDFLQDIFLKIAEKPHLFDASKKFYSWLFTVAANLCRTAHRDKKPEGPSVDSSSIQRFATDDVLVTKHDAGVFNQYLGKALDTLEYEQKETFILRFQEDLSIHEIAQIMQCSVGTVKSRIYYTTRKLALVLEEFKPLLKNN